MKTPTSQLTCPKWSPEFPPQLSRSHLSTVILPDAQVTSTWSLAIPPESCASEALRLPFRMHPGLHLPPSLLPTVRVPVSSFLHECSPCFSRCPVVVYSQLNATIFKTWCHIISLLSSKPCNGNLFPQRKSLNNCTKWKILLSQSSHMLFPDGKALPPDNTVALSRPS